MRGTACIFRNPIAIEERSFPTLRIKLTIFLVLLSGLHHVVAQLPPSPVLQDLEASLKRYTFAKQPDDIFLHLDKQVYTPNENIWFTAYLFNRDTTAVHNVLHCLLVEEPSKKIILSERFVIQGSFAGGAIFLPDTLKAGEYRLLAYTRSSISYKSKSVFQQSLTVKTPDGPLFKWSYIPVEEGAQKDTVHFKYKVTTAYGGVAADARVEYTLRADGAVITENKQLTTTNPFGEIILAVPRQKVQGRCVELQAAITRKQEIQQVSLVVPLLWEEIKVRHFAEGGSPVHGQLSAMGVEMKNAQGAPMAAKVELWEDERRIASFITDQYGMGMVKWVPDRQKKYTFRLENDTRVLRYDPLDIKPQGYSLYVPKAVISDSSFTVEIGVPPAGDTCHLILHDYRSVFFASTLVVRNHRAVLRLPASIMRQGVYTLTLFSAAGQPQAERAIYMPGSKPVKVQLITDSGTYHQRSKLKLKVKVTDSDDQPVQAVFSLACVLSTRIDQNRMADIARFWNFDRYLQESANLPVMQHLEDKESIERLLLTKYWTNYNWEKIHLQNKKAPVKEKNCDTGKVYIKNSQVSKPVPMVVVGGARTYMFETDYKGYFDVPAEAMRAAPGHKVIVMPVTGNKAASYRVEVYNGCATTDSLLAATGYAGANAEVAEWSVQEQELMKKALKPVTVTATRLDDGVFAGAAERMFSNCENDYVCMYNILNCPNHPGSNIRPVNGKSYYVMSVHQYVVYKCGLQKEEAGDFVKELNGVKYPKEFYVADYERFNAPMPEIMSTVFWSYQVSTNGAGEANIEFWTNDLVGIFHCILQGISSKGPISDKISFKVVENNPLSSNIPPGSINKRE